MPRLRRILLVRHGETDGDSSVRFHGSNDVGLSAEGLEQMARAARQVSRQPIDLVVASPWSSRVPCAAPGAQPGSWAAERRFASKGLTKEEIQACDPILYQDWQSGADGFAYPEGESREELRVRVGRGLERLMAADVHSALLVLHKGVIRLIVERLTGESLPVGDPPLGGVVTLTRSGEEGWFRGQHASTPPVLGEKAAERSR
jgi:broad specificity phosphatase PhoE